MIQWTVFCIITYNRVVEFATYSDMKNAYKKLNDTELSGRRIRLVMENPDDRRYASLLNILLGQ